MDRASCTCSHTAVSCEPCLSHLRPTAFACALVRPNYGVQSEHEELMTRAAKRKELTAAVAKEEAAVEKASGVLFSSAHARALAVCLLAPPKKSTGLRVI